MDFSKCENTTKNRDISKFSKESDPTHTYENYTIGYGDSTQLENKFESNTERYNERNARESGSRETYTILSLPSKENDRWKSHLELAISDE